jgi:hypothetical protein
LTKPNILLHIFSQSRILLRSLIYLVLLVLTLIVFAIAFTGCSKYTLFENTEGYRHFSFEYPDRFIFDRINVDDSIQGKTMNFYFTESDTEQHLGPLLLDIFVLEKSELYPDYQVRLEYSISYPINKDNFRLITRDEIMISDLQGERISYSYDIQSSKSKLDMIGMGVYFYDTEYNWEIKLIAPSINQEEILDEFDHIIETFQILD